MLESHIKARSLMISTVTVIKFAISQAFITVLISRDINSLSQHISREFSRHINLVWSRHEHGSTASYQNTNHGLTKLV